MSEPSERAGFSQTLVVILIIVASMVIMARLIPEPRTIDDAFITFRYSRNIVDGNGFVYNPGSRTLGTTTPLYTLLMAGIGLVSGSAQYPWFALVTNALADAITAMLLGLLLYRITRRLVLVVVVGILWAISPMSVTFAIGGMETSVAIMWGVAAAYAYWDGRDRWMAFFAALGVLTRIDSLIWVGPLFAHQLLSRWWANRGQPTLLRRIPWQDWAVFTAILVPWHVFSWTYFGSLLSRSMSAKRLAYEVADLHALTRMLQHIATPFFEHETLGVPGIMIGIVLYPALAGVGTFYAVRHHARLVPFLLYPWLYAIVFSAANPLIFRWYLAPMLPAYFVAILMGCWALVEAIFQRVERPQMVPVALAAVGLVFGLFSLNAWVLEPDHGPDRPTPEMAWHEIELDYRAMAEALRDEYGVTEDTAVAAGDIGAVGYYSRAHIVDTVGLVTPEIADYYPLDKHILVSGENYAVPPAIIFDYRPDYIVLMENFVINGLGKDPMFDELYAEVREIPTDYYGTRMILYQRRDLAEPDG